CALAGALPDGHALGVGAQWSAVRTSRARSDAALRRLLPGMLRLVRKHVSDDLAATGDDHAGARSGTLIPGTPEHRGERDQSVSLPSSLYFASLLEPYRCSSPVGDRCPD